ncbi:AAA family ATPase, partial [Porticoccaceae bacterium]|nr:AAA family ATPase [Porticoccaceae bacterium]MDB2664422.1 AAA family ATPase [Porticoccaceae bacterium]
VIMPDDDTNIVKRNQEIALAMSIHLENAKSYEERSTEISESHFFETRRWKGAELANAVGVPAKTHIYMAESDGRLPEEFKEIRNEKGYTLSMVNEARKVFGTTPGRNRDFGDACVVFSFTNFKGGCYKTLTTQMVAAAAATEGFKVLVCDLDAQGTLSLNLGYTPDVHVKDEHTLSPALLADPAAVESEDIKKLVRKTYIDGLDIIPANMYLQQVEFKLQQKLYENSEDMMSHEDILLQQKELFLRVNNVVNKLRPDYDVIFLDGTPSLGMIPLGITFASDRVIVPCPTESPDYMATCTFWEMLDSRFTMMSNFPGRPHPLPELSVLPTRFGVGVRNNTHASQTILSQAIYPTFTSAVMKNVVRKHDSAISQQNLWRRTMFDVPYNVMKVKKEAQIKCVQNYQDVWAEIRDDFIYPLWPSAKYIDLEGRI